MPVAGTGNRVRRQGRPPHRAGESDGQDKTQHQAQAINIDVKHAAAKGQTYWTNQKVAAQVLWRGARYSAALEEETSTTAAGTAEGRKETTKKGCMQLRSRRAWAPLSLPLF